MKKSKEKSKKRIVLLIMGLIVLVVGISNLSRGKKDIYSEAKVTKASIETYYTFAGNVESENTHNIMAERAMQISEIKVSEGDKVEKDDILFTTSQGQDIKSKISGTVSKIYIQEDESVMAGSNICDIIDFENLQVTIKVDEYDLSSIEIDKEVSVMIDAIDKTIKGKLSDISDTATTQNGVAYFTATLDLEKDSDIKVGMTAEAKMLNKSAKDILTIPMKALQFKEDNEAYVLIKSDKNTPKEQYIKIGIHDGKTVEVTEGLKENQTILYRKATDSQRPGAMPPPMTRR